MSSGVQTVGTRNRRSMLSAAILAGVLLLAAIFLIPKFFSSGSGGNQQQLATAAISSFPVTDSATGTAVPESELAVNFGSAGQVSEVDVQVGQQVSRGTVLAKLNSSVPQSDVARAEAAVSSANAALAAAENPLAPGHQTQLQSALTSSQEVYNQTVASTQAITSQDTVVVTADKQQLALYQQQLSADACSSVSPSNALVCQNVQNEITSQEGTLQEDEARAKTDNTNGQLRISQAQAQVNAAQSALQASGTANPTAIAAAQAAVSAANAQLQSAETELANTTLFAPTSGTVLELNGQIGENVTGGATNTAVLPGTDAPIPTPSGSASSTSTAGSGPFIVIGNANHFVVGVPFPAADAQQLSPGQPCTMTTSTTVGAAIPCHVLAIAAASTTVNGSPVIYGSVVPNTSAAKLSSGESVDVSVQVSQANSVLAVPVSSVYMVGGVPHVDVWNGHHAVPTAVSTGMQGTSLVQITSGLNPGEQVVVAAYQGLPQTNATVPGLP